MFDRFIVSNVMVLIDSSILHFKSDGLWSIHIRIALTDNFSLARCLYQPLNSK
jgi:hypothetical protein